MGNTKRIAPIFLGALIAGLMFVLLTGRPEARVGNRPNILFVMTDDQPKDTMLAMPNVRERIRDVGTRYSNAYVSESLCCPSRVSILRGQYPHNTQVVKNGPPQGGAQTFRSSGLEQDTVATRLRQGGYATALVGKYLNGYDASYAPPGWAYWYARADSSLPGVKVRENGTVIDYAGQGGNMADRFEGKALAFLDRRTDTPDDPAFALFLWTGQPHLTANDYADRYQSLYKGEQQPRTPSFEEPYVGDKPAYIQGLPRLSDEDKAQIDQWRRNQLRASRQVDDTVGKMLDLLRDRGELDNTYVVFTTDNSTHMGQHRYFEEHGAKSTPYEEAANVPMYIRGPGVVRQSSTDITINNDIAPTFERIAGLEPPGYTDGRSLLTSLGGTRFARSGILNERPLKDASPAPPYHAVINRSKSYVEYQGGEREFYDRSSDPYQLQNVIDSSMPAIAAMKSQLQELETCSGDGCRLAENGPPLP